MKLTKRIFAVILCVAMIFSAFPLAVFANDEVDPDDLVDPKIIVSPWEDLGTGSTGTVTVTLTASQLADLLSSASDFDALMAAFNEMVERVDGEGNTTDENGDPIGSLITFPEIMEIVPFVDVIGVLVGEDDQEATGFQDLINKLGGPSAVRDMIEDQLGMITETFEKETDDVLEILKEVEGIAKAINLEAVMSLGLNVNYGAIKKYLDMAKVREKFAELSTADKKALFGDKFDEFVDAMITELGKGTLKDDNGNVLTIADLVTTEGVDPTKVNKVVQELVKDHPDLYDQVISDVLNHDPAFTIPNTSYQVKMDEVKALLDPESETYNEDFKDALLEGIWDNYAEIITEAGMLALANILKNSITISDLSFLFDDSTNIEDYLDVDAILAAAQDPDNTFLTEAGLQAVLDATEFELPSAAQIKDVFVGHSDYYVFDTLKSAITTAGYAALYASSGVTPDVDQVFQVLNETTATPYYDLDLLKNAITDAGKLALVQGLVNAGTVTKNDILTTVKGNAANYDKDKVQDALVQDKFATYAYQEYGVLPSQLDTLTDEQVFKILSEHEDAYNFTELTKAITDAGKSALFTAYGSQLSAATIVTTLRSNGDYYDSSALEAAFTDAGKQRLLEVCGFNPTVDQVMEILTADSDNYDFDTVKAAITNKGLFALYQEYGTLPTAGQIKTVLANSANYNEKLLPLLVGALTDDGKNEIVGRLIENGRTISASDLKTFMATGANYNSDNLVPAVLAALNDGGLDLPDVAELYPANLLADATIGAYLRSRFNDYLTQFDITVSEVMTIVDKAELGIGGIDQFLSPAIYGSADLINLAMNYLNSTALVQKILGGSLSNLDGLLGKDPAGVDYTFMDVVSDENVIQMSAILNAIAHSEHPEEYIYLDVAFNLLNTRDLAKFLRQVAQAAPRRLSDELKDDIGTILKALDNTQVSNLIALVVNRVYTQFHKVLLNGFVVAKNDGVGLRLNFDAIISAIWSIIPKFEEVGADDFDGTLLSFNLYIDYETYGEYDEIEGDIPGENKIKDINVVIKIGDSVDSIRRIAKLLDRYIQVEKENNYFTMNINVPGIVTDLYRALLVDSNSEAVISLREKFLAMEGMTGKEFATALSEIPLSEIVAGLKDVEIDHLYERLVASGAIKKLLTKINEYAGLHVDISSVSTLDDLLNHFRRDDISTISDLIDKVTEKTGMDLYATLEKVANLVDTNEYAQKLVEKLRSIPGVGKFFQNVTAQQVLEEYKDMNPIEAMVTYATVQLNRDLKGKFYSDKTAAQLYQDVLTSAEKRLSGYYRDFCNFLVNANDPDYTPSNEILKRIMEFIPDKFITEFSGTSPLDVYKGNGVFSASLETANMDLDTLAERFIDVLGNVLVMTDEMKTLATGLLPTGKFYYGGLATINFVDIYQVDYYKKDGSKLLSTYLPKGVDPMIIRLPEVEGFKSFWWVDETGEKVEKISKDQKVYSLYVQYVTATYKQITEDGVIDLGSETVLMGETLSEYPTPTAPDEIHDWRLSYYENMADEDHLIADISAYEMTGDVTIYLGYKNHSLLSEVTYQYENPDGSKTPIDFTETIDPLLNETLTGVPAEKIPAEPAHTYGEYTLAYYDADGNLIEDITAYTPAASCTITLKHDLYHTVKFIKDGAELTDYTKVVKAGDTVEITIPDPAPTDGKHYWRVLKLDGSVIEADTLTAAFAEPIDRDYTVEISYSEFYIVSFIYNKLDGSAAIDLGTANVAKDGKLTAAQVPAAPETPADIARYQLCYFDGETQIDDVLNYTVSADKTITLRYVDQYPAKQVVYKYGTTTLFEETVDTWAGKKATGVPADTLNANQPAVPAAGGHYKVVYKSGDQVIDDITAFVPAADCAITVEYVLYHTVTFTYKGQTVDTAEVLTNDKLTADQIPDVDEPDTPHTWAIHYHVGETEITPTDYTVTKDVTVQITYENVTVYTITWDLGYEGAPAATTTQVEHGVKPTYTGTPTRTGYTFKGWSPAIVAATANATYTAVWEKNVYTITWKDGETVLTTTEVAYEDTPVYTGAALSRTGYTFKGWSPAIVAATEDTTYTATWEKNVYTITWSFGTYEGAPAATTTQVTHGNLPTHADPTRPADASYTYTFKAWTPAIVAATGNATYTATWTATPIVPPVTYYTITWDLGYEGAPAAKQTQVEAGQKPTYSGTPTRPADASYTYTFNGWTPTVVAATGNTTYTATWTATPIVPPSPGIYTVTFKYGDETLGTTQYDAGSILASKTIPSVLDKKPVSEYELVVNYYVGDDKIDISTYAVTKDVTVVLKWEKLAITVVYWDDATETFKEITYDQIPVTAGGAKIKDVVKTSGEGEDVIEPVVILPEDAIPVGEGANYTNHYYVVGKDGIVTNEDIAEKEVASFNGNRIVVVQFPDYFSGEVTDEDDEVIHLFPLLSQNEDGEWTLDLYEFLILDEEEKTMKGGNASEDPVEFTMYLDFGEKEKEDFDKATSLTVRYGETTEVSFTGKLLEKLQAEETLSMKFSIELVVDERYFDSPILNSDLYYHAPAYEVYNMQLLVAFDKANPDSGMKIGNFENGLSVTLKPRRVKLLPTTATQRVNAYILEDERATSDNLYVTTSSENVTITFRPPHFTEIGIVNEYLLNMEFVGSVETGLLQIGENLVGKGVMIPEGATLKNITAKLSDDDAEFNRVVRIRVGDTEIPQGEGFVMPSAPTTITVETESLVETVTIVINGEEHKVPLGSAFPFEITIKPGEKFEQLPNATLLSVKELPDGSKVYVFCVIAVAGMKPITYTIGTIQKTDHYVTNGLDGDKQAGEDYKSTADTTFYNDVYHMQVRDSAGKLNSLWWLWILLIIALLVVLIACLYLLIVKKDLGPNLFTAIIVGIVHAFFTMCLGVYGFFTGKIFRKKS